jgi:hypothetical protein
MQSNSAGFNIRSTLRRRCEEHFTLPWRTICWDQCESAGRSLYLTFDAFKGLPRHLR